MKQIVIILIAAMLLVIPVSSFIDAQVCAYRWSDFNTEYSLLSGCKVEIDGRFVPEDMVRIGQ